MINDARVLGLIPARGGSKGVPRKNIRLLAGKPLVQWTIETAQGSRYIDYLVLSTDDAEIANLADRLHVDVTIRRPAEAASDEAPAIDVINHALGEVGGSFKYLVYLQPTSPLRSTADIDNCIELLIAAGADSCVSVAPSPFPAEWLYRVSGDGYLEPAVANVRSHRRQDLEPSFVLNGAVYAVRINALQGATTLVMDRTVALTMPPDRSVDIDTEHDLRTTEAFLLLREARP